MDIVAFGLLGMYARQKRSTGASVIARPVAERASVLDILSGGRLEFGTGRSATWTELGGFRASGFASTVQPGSGADSVGLLQHMGHDPVDIDALCLRAGMSAEQVSSELLRLELDGRVAALPGGLFQRVEKRSDR